MNSSAAVYIVLAIGAAIAIWYFYYYRNKPYIAKCNKPLQRKIPGGCDCVENASRDGSGDCHCNAGYNKSGNKCLPVAGYQQALEYDMNY